jgi:peptidoglycan hydrolase-like protein with peptidoglycan-binding domain
MARAEAAAREKAEAEARAAAEAEAKRKAEADARKADEDKAKADAEAKRQAEAAEATLRLGEPDRKRVQVALTALGFDTRGADGAFGPRTRAMIAAWQKKQTALETGYLTAPQFAALRQQAAPAIARFDEEQKSQEDDKRKTEDEAKRRLDEQRGERVLDLLAPNAASGIDGVYTGEFCQGRQLRCVPASLTVRDGVARLEWSVDRCRDRGSMSIRIDASGAVAGTTSGFQDPCAPVGGRVWGRLAGQTVSIEGTWGGGDNIRATFTKGGAPLAMPQEPPRPSTAAPSAAAAPSMPSAGLDGQWTGRLDCGTGPRRDMTIAVSGGSGKDVFTTRFGPGHVALNISGISVSGEVSYTGFSGGPWTGQLSGSVEGVRLKATATTRGQGSTDSILCTVTLSR